MPVESVKRVNCLEWYFFSIQQDKKYGYLWLVSSRGLYAVRKRVDNLVETIDISDISSKLNNILVKYAWTNRVICGSLLLMRE